MLVLLKIPNLKFKISYQNFGQVFIHRFVLQKQLYIQKCLLCLSIIRYLFYSKIPNLKFKISPQNFGQVFIHRFVLQKQLYIQRCLLCHSKIKYLFYSKYSPSEIQNFSPEFLSSIHSPFCFTETALYIEVFTLSFNN